MSKDFIWNLWNDLLDDFYSDPLRPSISLKKPAQATKVSNFYWYICGHMHTCRCTHTHPAVKWCCDQSSSAPTHLHQTLYLYPWHVHAPIQRWATLLLWNIFPASLLVPWCFRSYSLFLQSISSQIHGNSTTKSVVGSFINLPWKDNSFWF